MASVGLGSARSGGFLRSTVLAILATLCIADLQAAGPFTGKNGPDQWVILAESDSAVPAKTFHAHRALAAGLALALGPFGGHRIYLGTNPKVPVFYALTFGGFGVLVLIDLGHILFTKDLAAYVENDRVLMWAKSRGEAVIPP